jgi:hypothetical protein
MASAVVVNDVEGPLPAQTLLYIPDFLEVMVQEAEETLNYEIIHKDLLLKDWITPGLSTHIQSLFPSANQIDQATGSRDLETFKIKCLQLFSQGRFFASHKQVEQSA